MNTKSNLAFVIEPTEEVLESRTLNAAELDALLRLGSHRADVRVRAHAARGRRTLVSFRDNHSDLFRAFRVY